jgi:hypothetical protein
MACNQICPLGIIVSESKKVEQQKMPLCSIGLSQNGNMFTNQRMIKKYNIYIKICA